MNSQRVELGETRDYADTVTETRVGEHMATKKAGGWVVCWVCDGLKGGVSFSAQARLSTKPAFLLERFFSFHPSVCRILVKLRQRISRIR